MKLGKSFKIGYIDDDGRFLPLAFSQSASIDRKTSSTEVSSPLTGGWEERRPKRNSWSMQHEGLLGSNTAVYKYKGKTYDFWALMKKLWLDKYIFTARWQEVLASGLPGDMVQGQCFIDDMKQVASEKALTKVSVNLTGTGELRDLSAEDLTGAFAYSIQGHTMTLYTITRPIDSFSVHAGTTAVGVWDETATGRTQTFTDDAITASSVITAWKGEGAAATEQTGVVFTDCTTLHVVLLQTDERDSMQQLHRYVQPLWWGGLSMGDMTLKRGTDTVAEFATAGLTGSAPRVEINPGTDITLDNYTWTLVTDAPQTIHCTDRTTSLQRTLLVAQQQSNRTELPYIVYVEPDLFSCPNTIWGNDDNDNTAFSVNEPSLARMIPSAALLPDAQHLHWQLTGLGADETGPYQVQRELVTDTAQHEVFYAYDATTQKLRVWCPNEVLTTILIADDVDIHSGLLYDTDGQGNRVPLTLTGVASFTTLTTAWGNYRFHNVSALTVFNLSNTLAISALPLDDIVLTGEGGTEVGRIPAISDPSVTYPTWQVVTTPGTIVTGAQMENGAAQTLTYLAYNQTVNVKTTATQTGENAWRIVVVLRDTSGNPAILPGDLSLKWGTNYSIVIPAGQSGTSETVDYNPAWIDPAVTLHHPKAADFYLYTAPTPDITEDHWVAYKLGLVGGAYYYDVAYTGGSHSGIILTGSFMQTAAEIKIAAGQQVASRLYVATGSSEDNISIGVRGNNAPGWSAATIDHLGVNTTDKLVLSYRLGEVGSTTVTNLTNIKEYTSGAPVYSRHSCIADILPFVKVMYSYSTIYNSVGLEGLKPGNTEAFEAQALYGIYSGDDSGVNVRAHFTDSNGNTISVGSDLTGVKVLAVNHSAELPFA